MMEYRIIDKLNQSLLKEILKSPQAYVKAKEKYTEQDDVTPAHFVFGSAVDHLVTEDIEFTDKFHIMGESLISDTVKKIVDHVWSEVMVNDLNDAYESIVRACGYEKYGQAWKEETRVNKIIDQGNDYFHSLKASAGKTIISQSDYGKAVTCHASMIADPYISKYLCVPTGYLKGNQELIKKKVIEFEYRDIEFKCELDLVYIDHLKKMITPIDVKTIGTSVYSFPYNFWKYRYDFQAAVYTYAIHAAMSDLIDKGYKVDLFKFIVCEKDSYNKPMIYTTTEDILNIGMNGGTSPNGTTYEGFEQAIERYKYHMEKDNWDYPMEYYESGEMSLE